MGVPPQELSFLASFSPVLADWVSSQPQESPCPCPSPTALESQVCYLMPRFHKGAGNQTQVLRAHLDQQSLDSPPQMEMGVLSLSCFHCPSGLGEVLHVTPVMLISSVAQTRAACCFRKPQGARQPKSQHSYSILIYGHPGLCFFWEGTKAAEACVYKTDSPKVLAEDSGDADWKANTFHLRSLVCCRQPAWASLR